MWCALLRLPLAAFRRRSTARRRRLVGRLDIMQHGVRRISIPDVVRPAVDGAVGLLAPERHVQLHRDPRAHVLGPSERRAVLYTHERCARVVAGISLAPTHQPTSASHITPTRRVDVT